MKTLCKKPLSILVFILVGLFAFPDKINAQSPDMNINVVTDTLSLIAKTLTFAGRDPITKEWIFLQSAGQERSILRYNSCTHQFKMTKIDFSKLSNDGRNKNISIGRPLMLNGKLFFLMSVFTRAESQIFVASVSAIENGELSFTHVTSLAFHYEMPGYIACSPDSSKIVISVKHQKKSMPQNLFRIVLFDTSLNLICNNDVTLSNWNSRDHGELILNNLYLTKTNSVMMIGRKTPRQNWSMSSIWVVNPFTGANKELALNLEDMVPGLFVTHRLSNGEIIIAGIYNERRYHKIQTLRGGTFYGKFGDNQDSVTIISRTPLDSVMPRDFLDRNYYLFSNMRGVVKPDGGVILMLENIFRYRRQNHLYHGLGLNELPLSRTAVTVVNYQPNGIVQYYNEVRRNEFSPYGTPFLPVYTSSDQALKLIYYERSENYRSSILLPKNSGDWVRTVATINPQGQYHVNLSSINYGINLMTKGDNLAMSNQYSSGTFHIIELIRSTDGGLIVWRDGQKFMFENVYSVIDDK